jgi:hypothetical protein
MLLYNEAALLFNTTSLEQTAFSENFINGFNIWGYPVELLFRIFSCTVSWRSYQLDKFREDLMFESHDQ